MHKPKNEAMACYVPQSNNLGECKAFVSAEAMLSVNGLACYREDCGWCARMPFAITPTVAQFDAEKYGSQIGQPPKA